MNMQGKNTPMPKDDIRSRLGLRPVINVSGTMTSLGASIVVPEAVEVVSAILTEFVELGDLHRQASNTIADLTGAEAGFITASCSAAISLAVAAAMTGPDLAAIERLPDTTGLKDEVVILSGHMVGYGAPVEQAIRLTGAKVVPVGQTTHAHAYQLRGAIGEEAGQVVFGCRIDDHRHSALMSDGCEHLERTLTVVDYVVRHHVNRRRGLLANGAAQLVGMGMGRLADRHDSRSGEPDRLFDWRAVTYHVAREDHYLILEARRIRQPFDRGEIRPGHRRCHRQADRRRTGRGYEARIGTGEVGDRFAGLAMQVAEFHELGENGGHRLDGFWHHDRCAE